VVVNLYPFETTVARANVSFEEAIEQIDIGGPSLIRAAAKNFEDVAVVVDPTDYTAVSAELRQEQGCLSRTCRLHLAAKAFARVARYDALIAAYLERQNAAADQSVLPDLLHLRLVKLKQLRYGENPHQQAAVYGDILKDTPLWQPQSSSRGRISRSTISWTLTQPSPWRESSVSLSLSS
jgi:phosphoribosylaminoimidazolecarboxamide formyltransferase/IMP cyclohydrolase